MKLTLVEKIKEPFAFKPEGSDSVFYLTQFTSKEVRNSYNIFTNPLSVISDHVVGIENLYVGEKPIKSGVELAELLREAVGSSEVLLLVGQLVTKIFSISQLEIKPEEKVDEIKN